ncbi:MAG: STN and carboxypeptidase regulatory-like domain-containing protein [Bacteroidota bacterium]
MCKKGKKSTLFYYSLSIVVLIIGILHPNPIFAQENILESNISIKLKNIAVHEALSKITQKINYYFTFDGKILDAKRIISISFKDEPLKNCLDRIFDDPDLEYKIIDNHIVINKKELKDLNSVLINDTTINIIELHGKVIDKENGQSLAYAAIGIENHNVGSITNAQGSFILKIPKELINANLCVSFIGYLNTCIPVEKLYGLNKTIELQRNYISVQEVIIRSTDPKSIIRESNKNIKNNFCSKPNSLTTFYRESVKQKDKFMFFSEAVLKVYKAAYTNSFDMDQLKVLKSRSFHDVSEKDTVRLRLKSGLGASLSLDLVKNKIDFIDEDNFHLYNYKMVDIITYNNHPAYVIEFKQKEFVQDALYVGQLYVDIDKLAIIGAEFSINPEKINKAHSRFIVKKERGLRLRVKYANYRISYHEVNGKYYLRHVKGELKFRVKKKRKLFATTFETCLEMAVCSIDTINVQKPKRKETDKLNTIFVNEVREYDNTFWEDYNFIKPDDNWQEAINKLKLKLEQQKKVSNN